MHSKYIRAVDERQKKYDRILAVVRQKTLLIKLSAMQHIYFVRHGTTTLMEANKLQGSINSRLSTAGKREAEQTARALTDVQFDTVLCSPQGRAKETANIICAGKNNEIQILNDLREIDFGWIEGSTQLKPPSKDAGLIERLHLLFRVFLAQLSGESFRRVKKRGEKCWREIKRLHPEGTILIVAHGVILTQIIQFALQRDIMDPKNPVYLKPCNITEIIFKDGCEPEVVRLNSTSHLKK